MANNTTQARVVVGMDFGTTFSGFAYAHVSDPEIIHTFYEWPMQAIGGGKPYCKTQTSLYYVPVKASNKGEQANGAESNYELKEWAWPAQVMYLEDLRTTNKAERNVNGDLEFLLPSASRRHGRGQDLAARNDDAAAAAGFFVRRFKLHLAGPQDGGEDGDVGPSCSSRKQSDKRGAVQPSRRGMLRRMANTVMRAFAGSKPKQQLQDGKYAAKKMESLDPMEKEKARAVEAFKASGWVDHPSLASKESGAQFGYGVFNDLPPGMVVERAISDFLEKLSGFVMEHLQSTFGKHLSKHEVQWCLTVPAIWDDWAKQRMRLCAQRAGMVTGPHCPKELEYAASPHQLIVVLESEAASYYCSQRSKQLQLQKGDQFLVADIGGGTVDIVVHTKANDGEGLRLREVKQSMGGLCGGTYVDKNFVNFLADRIPVFVEYIGQHPATITTLLRRWEEIKCAFDGSTSWNTLEMELPKRLSTFWEEHDARYTNKDKMSFNYDELSITGRDMRAIFDPVVDQILELIREQMTDDIKLLMLVGGFSASPYLSRRVREAFDNEVTDIINPPDPGSAICQGAVALGLYPEIVMSRISRKTYGIGGCVPFESHHPESSLVTFNGVNYCRTAFFTFVRRGEAVEFDQQVKRSFSALMAQQDLMTIKIYSCNSTDVPTYTTDLGVTMEGSFDVDISNDPEGMGTQRAVLVSMFFGKSCIQLTAQRRNFGERTEVVEMHDSLGFESDFVDPA